MTIQRFIKSLNKAEGQFYQKYDQRILRREIIKENEREIVFKIYGESGEPKEGILFTIKKEGER